MFSGNGCSRPFVWLVPVQTTSIWKSKSKLVLNKIWKNVLSTSVYFLVIVKECLYNVCITLVERIQINVVIVLLLFFNFYCCQPFLLTLSCDFSIFLLVFLLLSYAIVFFHFFFSRCSLLDSWTDYLVRSGLVTTYSILSLY